MNIAIYFPDDRIAGNHLIRKSSTNLPARVQFMHDASWNCWTLTEERDVQISLRCRRTDRSIGMNDAEMLGLDIVECNTMRSAAVLAPSGLGHCCRFPRFTNCF